VRLPVSPVDSVGPAFEHTKEQLFRPFRLGQWTRLAFVGLLAGELSSGGGCNFQAPNLSHAQRQDFLAVPHLDPALVAPLIILAAILVPLFWLLLLYISSRMRFLLFDSVITKHCSIRAMWHARREAGLRYFVWQIIFSLVAFGGMAVIVGVPALFAFLLGWFRAPREHLVGLILAGVVVFFLFLGWMLLTLFVHVFTKDFVVPQMALENVSAFEGWRKLISMIEAEKGRYAGYAGMKVVLALGAAFVIGIVTLIFIVILLIPAGGVGVISVLLAKATGLALAWNVFTITLAVVAGCCLLLVFLYGLSLISVPVIVFFPAYSIHFFAARYPRLSNLLYPPLPPAPGTAPIG